MLAVTIYSAIDLAFETTAKSSPYCVVRFEKRELGKTSPYVENTHEPFWNENFSIPFHNLEDKVLENQRPLFFEYLEVELHLSESSECVAVARVNLINFRRPEWCRFICTSGKLQGSPCGRVLVGLVVNSQHSESFKDISMLPLTKVLSPSFPQYSPLYINFQVNSTQSNDNMFCSHLPGPTEGEVLVDRHTYVEWKVALGNNAFGDKYFVTCRGSLYVTDLRVIFIPEEVESPSWAGLPSVHHGQSHYSPEQVLLIRRTTYQMPLSCIEECRCKPSDSVPGGCVIVIQSRDNCTTEFTVQLEPLYETLNGIPALNDTSGSSVDSSNSERPILCLSSASAVHVTAPVSVGGRTRSGVQLMSTALPSNPVLSAWTGDNALDDAGISLYNNGLDTSGMMPVTWCARVQDYIVWAMKEDFTVLRWSKYIKQTCERAFDNSVLGKVKEHISVDEDYQRLHVMEAQWNMTDINFNFDICSTYPQTLVLPSTLSHEEIVAAASQRSRGRLPTLVWIHPQSHASLCRCSQPVVGLAGMPEHDRKMLVTIKALTASNLPLRIADCRPRINAQANAMQGKGFENVAYLGGSSVASLHFLDIDNIHVMRNSLSKLRERGAGDTAANRESASSLSLGADAVTSSKWLPHVSNVLRGAIGVAESLMQGHPVLVHCSDGWDRTAQLSALAQLLIDPYYRSIEGLFLLITKEWCSFGHKFEDRLSETSNKESSPVYLQFLDCLYQLCMQFPTDFAYSTHFLTLLAHATYSGFFTTFRENSECGRYAFMQQMFQSDRMESDDLQYSTVFCYMRILLRSNIAHTLTNPFYREPVAGNSKLKYLHPRHLVSDLLLWREGLFGHNQPNFKGFMATSPNMQECVAVTSATSARYFDYVALHRAELPEKTGCKLAQFVHHPSSLVPVVPYTLRMSKNFYDVVTNRSTALPEGRLERFEVATVRIQCWYRAICAIRTAVRSDEVSFVRPMVGQILFALVWSELRFCYTSRLAALQEVVVQVRGVINDALEDALNFCLRKEAAEARVVAFEQTMLNNARMIAEDAERAAKHKKMDLYGALTDHAKSIHNNINEHIRRDNRTNSVPAAEDETEDGEEVARTPQRKSVFSMFTKK